MLDIIRKWSCNKNYNFIEKWSNNSTKSKVFRNILGNNTSTYKFKQWCKILGNTLKSFHHLRSFFANESNVDLCKIMQFTLNLSNIVKLNIKNYSWFNTKCKKKKKKKKGLALCCTSHQLLAFCNLLYQNSMALEIISAILCMFWGAVHFPPYAQYELYLGLSLANEKTSLGFLLYAGSWPSITLFFVSKLLRAVSQRILNLKSQCLI